MSTEEVKKIVEQMAPRDAASSLAFIVRDLFKRMDDDDQVQFIVDLVGKAENDKVASLVHL